MLFSQTTFCQNKIALKGSIERTKVHGKSLEGNLEGDSADRYVSVYLPPSYKLQPKKRYPVIYFLHGYTDSDAKFFGLAKHWMNLPPILDSAFVNGSANEMILVMPNAYTQYQGSWYSNSITTGNWEDFITIELVSYIDNNFRTIPNATSRGLTGHSMGGYGTLRIGEKHPGIFSCIYLLSPATLNQSNVLSVSDFANTDTIKTMADFQKAAFWTKATFAMAAAWSPNPNNPPFYVDLPVKNNKLQYEVISKWAANMPLTTIDQYIFNLKQLRAIAFDAGTKDENIAASLKILDKELNKYKVTHFFEIYEGTHINRIAERIKLKMLPFFSSHLSFVQ